MATMSPQLAKLMAGVRARTAVRNTPSSRQIAARPIGSARAISNSKPVSFFDPQYEAESNSLQQQLAQLTSDTGAATDRSNQDFLISKNRLTDQRGEILKSLEQRFADSGILRSGINVAKQAEVGQDYTQDIGDLTRGLSHRLGDINQDKTSGTNTILSAQRSAKAASTKRSTESALAGAEASARRLANEAMTRKLASGNRSSSRRLSSSSRRLSSSSRPAYNSAGYSNRSGNNSQKYRVTNGKIVRNF